MRGSEFANTLPAHASHKREQAILDAVRHRVFAPISWEPIEITNGERRAVFHVSRDALRVGNANDSFRATVSHRTAQKIADELGLVLPTPKLSDEIWAQATVRVPPLPRLTWVQDHTMARTDRMLEESKLIDKHIVAQQGKGKRGLTADVGKDWVTTIRLWKPAPPSRPGCPDVGPVRSANYGWHTAGAPGRASTPRGGSVYQSVGLCHNLDHVDYSQVVRLVRRDVAILTPQGWLMKDIAEVAADPELSSLVSSEGPLPAMRHPAVPPSGEDFEMGPQLGEAPNIQHKILITSLAALVGYTLVAALLS